MRGLRALGLILVLPLVLAVAPYAVTALVELLGPSEAHAVGMVAGGSDSCTGQACSVTSLSASGAVQSTAGSAASAFIMGGSARFCGNGPSCTSYFQNVSGVSWQFKNAISMVDAGGGVSGDVFQGYTPNTATQFIGKANDGASAKAIRLRSSSAYSNATALLVAFENDTTVRASVDLYGQLRLTQGSPTKPTCAASQRGVLRYTEGGTGVADQWESCMKNSSDAYAWTVVATP